MKKIITYIVEVGKEFDDEVSCLEYERETKMKNIDGTFQLFDENFNLLPKTCQSSYEDCLYILTESMEDLSTVGSVMEEIGLPSLPTFECCCGLFYYDRETDEWVHVEEQYHKWADMLAKAKSYKKEKVDA